MARTARVLIDPMDFPERLAALRNERKLTQAQLANTVGVHVAQIGRYESGQAQPTLDVIRRLAVALSVTTDSLIFGDDERGPDEDLRLIFEAASRLDDEHKKLLKSLVEGVILRHDTRRVQAEAS